MKRIYSVLLMLLPLLVVNISFTEFCQANRTIGIGPGIIEFPEVYRFGEYQRTIFIYNGNDYEANFSLVSSGEIHDWIRFYETIDATTPISYRIVSPETTMPVILRLTIPDDASNGEYTGNVYTEFYPTENISTNTTAAGVIIRLPAIINVNVSGTQNLNASVTSVQLLDTEVNYLLPILIDIKNTGNVVATPNLNLSFYKNDVFITQFTTEMISIEPGLTKHNTIYWNTTGNLPGEYIAHVSIALENQPFFTNEYTFSLLAPGTLTRKGELIALNYSGSLVEHNLIRIEATFLNTGEIETKAKFLGELFRDGILIDTLESEEVVVPRYAERVLTAYYRLGSEPGSYSIEGFILFEGKETQQQTISFTLGSFSLSTYIPYALAVIFLIIIGGATVLLLRKRQTGTISVYTLKKSKTRQPVASSSPSSAISHKSEMSNQMQTSSKKTGSTKAKKNRKEKDTETIESFLDSVEIPQDAQKKASKSFFRK